MKLVLASGSPYRKLLLTQLGIGFICVVPSLNEAELKAKMQSEKCSPSEIAERLSFEKGQSVFKDQTEDCLVISGDQLVTFDAKILGKPETSQNALAQLEMLNGKTHQLLTAISVLSAKENLSYLHVSRLKMKTLSQQELINYIRLDNPVDCSGSYKIEKHGITLFEEIECDDFSAIQGIPLMWLSNYLKRRDYEFFAG